MSQDQDIEELVKKLLSDGFGYYPIKKSVLISQSKDAARILIDSLDHVYKPWELLRPGESLPDVGVIDKDGKDRKTFIHLSHDMPLLAQGLRHTSLQRHCLRQMDICRRYLENIGANIANRLGEATGNMELKQLVLDSTRISAPYNVSTLRFLAYPDVAGQQGASPHYDRSFITLHLGDVGGKLLIQNSHGEWEYASPPQGTALVFLGVKALELTDGKLKPCFHRSTTVRGRERSAAVMFIHADVGHPVPDAQAEYERFYASRGR